MRRLIAGLATALALAGAVAAAGAPATSQQGQRAQTAPQAQQGRQQAAQFPHRRHEGLFPLCTGCHQGIPSGDTASFFPSPQVCARCHDGSLEPKVSYAPPTLPVNNLKFHHEVHPERLAAAGDSALRCEACHSRPGGLRMEVASAPELSTCFACHAHQATEHQVDAKCSTCHVPLAESGFGLKRIEAIKAPADHTPESFLAGGHGKLAAGNEARCATCHTQDRCATCHVATDRKEIQAIPLAPAGMELPPAKAQYPVPVTHTRKDWLDHHGATASRTACATCHTRNDCESCHLEPLPKPVTTLPALKQTKAPGVGVKEQPPESHKSMFFLKTHPTLASTNPKQCATCHEEQFCTSCHDGPSQGGYHPAGFVAKHGAEAWGRDVECANCHNTTVFCRACHQESGLTSHGRLGPGYHDSEPLWLLRHGQAAREGLESCTTCHKQNDCTQCHSVLGAFKVSPHGPDFDAARAWATNPRPCTFCHTKNPLDGGGG